MKIERVSTRLVKPHTTIDGSGPLLVALSSADLAFPRVHVEAIYAYNAPVPPTMALEEGLSRVLSEYREWAGRLTLDARGRPAIELNDAGAVVVEAEAEGTLQDLWPFNPSPILLDLLPVNRGVPELFLAQVTRFACGGITVGVASHHQLADGEGACEFLAAWASVVRGVPIASTPLHDRSALMARDPPRPVFDHPEHQNPPPKPDGFAATDPSDLLIKKLHFTSQSLQKLKAEANEGGAREGAVVVYSTFVSLVAHVWRCITKARGLGDGEGETRVSVSVNVRKRLDSPLPKGYLGNAVCSTCAQLTMKDLVTKPLSFAASHVRDAITKVNNDYTRSALDYIELQFQNRVRVDEKENIPLGNIPLVPSDLGVPSSLTPNLSVASWTTLPFYDLDFGWGSPIFSGPPGVPFDGILLFVPSYTRDGSIDVVIGLPSLQMEKMETLCFA